MQATRESPPTQVRISRRYPVAPEKVWRAWTEPQALSRWFGPAEAGSDTRAEVDLREGGRWRVSFNEAGGQRTEVGGSYLEVLPHRRLVFSWAWKGTPDRISRVSLELKPQADGTLLDFVHDRFFDEQARINHERGWPVFFGQLDRLLSSTSDSTQA
jgi:uncharacterized protein YndB with AHSA1/START domain